MKHERLSSMKGGWFIGNFVPSLHKTNACEVAIKTYSKGDKEGKHYHKIATEYTVVIMGKVLMFNNVYEKGDIIIVEPGEATEFEALEDSVNVVVKIPGVNNDKYVMV